MERRSQTSDGHSGAIASFIGDGTRNRFDGLERASNPPGAVHNTPPSEHQAKTCDHFPF